MNCKILVSDSGVSLATSDNSQQRCDREVARWTCSHVADAAPEWPALLTTTTTATLMLRAGPSYPTVALFTSRSR